MTNVAIIGGSGVYTGLTIIKNCKEEKIKTPYGNVTLKSGLLKDIPVIFLSRHGSPPVLPHKINYHANIYALYKKNVTDIIATSAVGSIVKKFKPGTFVIPDQYIDFSKSIYTFADKSLLSTRHSAHVDMTTPFSKKLAKILLSAKTVINRDIYYKATYAGFSGPQFETSAEINMAKQLGAHLVGMTVIPEAKLSRELNVEYQPLCTVVNYAAGISSEPVTHETTLKIMNETIKDIEKILENTITRLY